MPIKIFFISNEEDQGKAKGVWVEEESNDIPQIVGLSKLQFFMFLLATIIMGAGIFGIGYTLAYFKKEGTGQKLIHNKQELLNQNAINASIQSSMSNAPGSNYINYPSAGNNSNGQPCTDQSNTNGQSSEQMEAQNNANATTSENSMEIYSNQSYYVVLGLCKTEIESKNLLDKLKLLGKTGKIKPHDGYLLVYLGPYASLSMAENEIDSITLETSMNASIVRSLI